MVGVSGDGVRAVVMNGTEADHWAAGRLPANTPLTRSMGLAWMDAFWQPMKMCDERVVHARENTSPTSRWGLSTHRHSSCRVSHSCYI